MEDDPFLVPSERGEAQERRNEGGDEGSNGSNSDGVLVSPSSSPEPQAALPPLRPSSYPVRGSVFAGRGLYRIDTHRAEDLTPELLKEIRSVHERCFPEEKSDECDDDDDYSAWLQRATFCHEPRDCVWILLYQLGGGEESETSPSSSSSLASSVLASWLPFFTRATPTVSSGEEKKGEEREKLVGLVTGVPYSSSLFGFNLGVVPRLRGRGLGARLMHSLQAAARARGLSAISATVDADKRRLVGYYCGHGGVVEAAGITSPGSAPPTVVRVVKRFDDEELARVTKEADERIFELVETKRRRRRRRRRSAVVAAAAVSFFAVAALALALLRGRAQQRRRLLK